MLKLTFLIGFSLIFSTADLNQQVDEMTLKAVYLERFTRFVEWPNTSIQDFYKIQVAGSKDFAKELKKTFENIKIKGKEVMILEAETYSKEFNPHLLFIAYDKKQKVEEIIATVPKQPVLIITEGAGMISTGSMINIYRQQSKLKFEVNEQAIQNSKLYVSYRLMQAAERVVNPITQ